MAGRLDGRFQTTNVVVHAGAVVMGEEVSISTGLCLVAGTITAPLQVHQLKVETSGRVQGRITATKMDVLGQIQGEVIVQDVVVRNRGTIDGQVLYANLSMERGSEVNGKLQRKDCQGLTTVAETKESVVIHLPVRIVQQLLKKPHSLQLSLPNGAPQSAWFSHCRLTPLEHGTPPFFGLRAHLDTGLMGCALTLAQLQAFGQDMAMSPSFVAMTEEPQRSLQQLKRQFSHFHRTTDQVNLKQKKQGQAIEQQVVDIEDSLNSLGVQLAQVQAHSLLQLQDLRATNRLLWVAVWALAILAHLVWWRLLRAWLFRQTAQTIQDLPATSPQAGTTASIAPVFSPIFLPVASKRLGDAVVPMPAVSQAPDAKVTKSPEDSLSAAGSNLLGTATNNTQTALAPARESFMRLPLHIT